MNEYHKISEGILGEETIEKTNTELFLSLVGHYFPEAIKDGEVDFTALKEEMGEFHEVGSEHYDFTWAGKQSAKKEAQSDIFGRTLKYKPQDSLNPDTTENIYIEGDNLEALKLLRRNYHGKIKMIYIDPPYNTGNDFVYHDNFAMTEEELANLSGDIENGVRLKKNPKDNARYHTNWLNMMYPRLKIARDLLTDDGVIFISIDDNEVDNLRKTCDEVFGGSNFIAQLIWQNKKGGGNDSRHIAIEHEYIIVYAKNIALLGEFYERYSDDYIKRYKENDDKGRFFWDTFKRKAGKQYYPITCPDGTILEYDDDGNPISWLRSKPRFESDIKEGEIRIVKIGEKWSVQFKQRIPQGKTPRSIFTTNQVISDRGTTSTGANDVYEYFKKDVFSNPKPVELINFLIGFGLQKDDIVLDFFSGSGTTAEAVICSNMEGNNYKYILIQLDENIDPMLNSSSANAKRVAENAVAILDELGKPHLITELAKERIRRAAKKIHEDNPEAKFDDGFKVFKVADTNIRWNTTDDEEIISLADNDYSTGDKDNIDFTPGHNDIDIVYEIMLRQFDIPLSTPIEKLPEVSDRTYIFANAVVVCLEPEIDENLIEKLASIEPVPGKFVLRDSAFNDDIELKDVSYRRLSALIANHQLEGERKNRRNNYTVEFI